MLIFLVFNVFFGVFGEIGTAYALMSLKMKKRSWAFIMNKIIAGNILEIDSIDYAAALLVRIELNSIETLEDISSFLKTIVDLWNDDIVNCLLKEIISTIEDILERKNKMKKHEILKALETINRLFDSARSHIEIEKPAIKKAAEGCKMIKENSVNVFVNESMKNLLAAEAALLNLEKAPRDKSAINDFFSAFHVIRESAPFYKLHSINDLTRRAETVFEKIRDGKSSFDDECAALAIGSFDALRSLIERHVENKAFGPDPCAEMLAFKAKSYAEAVHEPGPDSGAAEKALREFEDAGISARKACFKPIFQNLALLVRDVAGAANKNVDFIARGYEIEIDRNAFYSISEALTSIVRDAIDYGIETAAGREKAGKPKAGKIELRAFQSGGNVVVEVTDDGKGLDRKKILRNAIKSKIIGPTDELSDGEIFDLVFMSGFSTASEFINLPGRLAGLAAVKKSIEDLRGTIEIVSKKGEGAKFTIKFPIAPAMMDGMIVTIGDQKFIIPMRKIKMTIKPSLDDACVFIQKEDTSGLQEDKIPMLRTHDILGIEGRVEKANEGLLVVVEEERSLYALLVDDIIGQRRMVIKPPGSDLENVKGVSSGAFIGNGKIGLIIEPADLIKMAKKSSGACFSI